MIEYHKNLSLENLFYIDENGIVQEEEWVDCVKFCSYKISNLARLKGKTRIVKYKDGRSRVQQEKIKEQTIAYNGYLHTMLTLNKKNHYMPIHKLVAMTFLGHVPCGQEEVIDHFDNNRLNNLPYNLRLTSSRENNSKKSKTYSSKYVGVRKRENRYYLWEAQIFIKKKSIFLCAVNDEVLASQYYLIALKNIDKYDGNNAKFRTLIKNILKDK